MFNTYLKRRVDRIWLFLIGLTLVSAWIAEEALEPGLGITLLVAAIIGIKGRMITDHFMELAQANRRIRIMMQAYFYVLPALVLITYLFGSELARLTRLS